MNELEFNAYMQSIAQALKAIEDNPSLEKRRFATIEEVWDAQRAKIDYDSLFMVVMREEGAATGLGTSNLVESHSAGFWLVRKCAKVNHGEYRQAYDDALNAGRAIIGKMVKDKSEGHPLMRFFDLSKVDFKKAGPVFGGFCYGMEFSFRMAVKAGCEYKYEEGEWNL